MQLESDSIQEFSKAMVKAQEQINHAAKDKIGVHSNKYADLEVVINCCKKALNDNGIWLRQPMIPIDGEKYIVTILTHISGEWIRSYTPVIQERKGSQGFGSGQTYARRYGLASLVGIAQTDDDGCKADNLAPKGQPCKEYEEARRLVGNKQTAESIMQKLPWVEWQTEHSNSNYWRKVVDQIKGVLNVK